MGNKLYEESYIQNIADVIRSKNGSTNTYKISEMASAIESIQTGTVEENRLVFTGTITETIVGSGKYVALVKDSKLAEIRNETNLLVIVEFDIDPTVYTLKKTWATNTLGTVPTDIDENLQFITRYGADGAWGSQVSIYAVSDNTSPTVSVGRLYITEDGELQIYSNSSGNYAIRPSNYKVIVEW